MDTHVMTYDRLYGLGFAQPGDLVECVDSGMDFTVGRVYPVLNDGWIKSDDGYVLEPHNVDVSIFKVVPKYEDAPEADMEDVIGVVTPVDSPLTRYLEEVTEADMDSQLFGWQDEPLTTFEEFLKEVGDDTIADLEAFFDAQDAYLAQEEQNARDPKNSTAPEALVNEREVTHGRFTETSKVSQALKEVLFPTDWEDARAERYTPIQAEALDMISSKLSRIVAGDPDFKDHWADIAGYAQMVADQL